MSNMPEMAKRETIIFRYIRRFHEQILNRIQNDTKETLRSAAWQIDAYLEEHGKFKDAEFLITILHTIEYVIQKKCNTNWTVARAKKDLRGRTRGVNQWSNKNAPHRRRPPVAMDLSQMIDKRLIEVPHSESD